MVDYAQVFRHTHGAHYNSHGELQDVCRFCGLDIRDPVHTQVGEKDHMKVQLVSPLHPIVRGD